MSEEAAERVSRGEMIALLRSVADAMETGEACEVHVGLQTINVPGQAEVEVEYARDGDDEQLDIELTWNRGQRSTGGRNLRAKAGLGIAVATAAIAAGAALLEYIQKHRESSVRPTESTLRDTQKPDPQEG